MLRLAIFLLPWMAIAQSPEPYPKTLEEALRLEEGLQQKPDDAGAREALLKYYFVEGRKALSRKQRNEARRKHVLWFIEHRPEDSFAGSPYAQISRFEDAKGHEQAAAAWQKAIGVAEPKAAVLANAGRFYGLNDLELSGSLLERALKIDPNNQMAARDLAYNYRLRASRAKGEAARAALATKAFDQMESAARLATNAKERFYALNDLAKMAFEAGDFEKAGSYAKEVLESAARYPDDWNFGNAIHQGNVVLGRLDLRGGDVGKAKEHLLAAGRTKGSPQLNSFGPNMALAKELLEKREREAVLEYLDLCAVFWKLDYGRLGQWKAAIRGGSTPDFGASLYH